MARRRGLTVSIADDPAGEHTIGAEIVAEYALPEPAIF